MFSLAKFRHSVWLSYSPTGEGWLGSVLLGWGLKFRSSCADENPEARSENDVLFCCDFVYVTMMWPCVYILIIGMKRLDQYPLFKLLPSGEPISLGRQRIYGLPVRMIHLGVWEAQFGCKNHQFSSDLLLWSKSDIWHYFASLQFTRRYHDILQVSNL